MSLKKVKMFSLSKQRQRGDLAIVCNRCLYMEEFCQSGHSQSCQQSHIQWQKLKLDKLNFEIKEKFLTGL